MGAQLVIRRFTWLFIGFIVLTFFLDSFFPVFALPARPMSREALDLIGVVSLGGLSFGLLLGKVRMVQHVDTYFHEFGHAVTATFMGGTVRAIKLNTDSSGVTHFAQRKPIGRLRRLLISAGGPMASSITLFIAMTYAARGHAPNLMAASAFIVFLVLLTTMRSIWGWVVGILIIVAMLSVANTATGWLLGEGNLMIQGAFLAAFCGIAAGVATRYSIRSLRSRNPSSDEYRIAESLRLPKPLIDIGLIIANVAFSIAALGAVGSLDALMAWAPKMLADSPVWVSELISQTSNWIGNLGK